MKRAVKQALRAISADPESGIPLLRQLDGLWKYRVRRFRIVYAIERRRRVIRIFAVGHRRDVYEFIARSIREAKSARADE